MDLLSVIRDANYYALESEPDYLTPQSLSTFTESSLLVLKDSTKIFCKYSEDSLGQEILSAEIKGLEVLSEAAAVAVPPVVIFESSARITLLGLLWIEKASWSSSQEETFGANLAELHKGSTAKQYGFEEHNFIGGTRQLNSFKERWGDFYVQQRIFPQIEFGKENGWVMPSFEEAIINYAESWRSELNDLPSVPSLLHGDLWSGNAFCSTEGIPYIIDPAVSYGDREAELAFMQLFGGFGRKVFESYQEVFPLEDGFQQRKEFYNLYHIMNHANLFGGSYITQVAELVR